MSLLPPLLLFFCKHLKVISEFMHCRISSVSLVSRHYSYPLGLFWFECLSYGELFELSVSVVQSIFFELSFPTAEAWPFAAPIFCLVFKDSYEFAFATYIWQVVSRQEYKYLIIAYSCSSIITFSSVEKVLFVIGLCLDFQVSQEQTLELKGKPVHIPPTISSLQTSWDSNALCSSYALLLCGLLLLFSVGGSQ